MLPRRLASGNRCRSVWRSMAKRRIDRPECVSRTFRHAAAMHPDAGPGIIVGWLKDPETLPEPASSPAPDLNAGFCCIQAHRVSFYYVIPARIRKKNKRNTLGSTAEDVRNLSRERRTDSGEMAGKWALRPTSGRETLRKEISRPGVLWGRFPTAGGRSRGQVNGKNQSAVGSCWTRRPGEYLFEYLLLKNSRIRIVLRRNKLTSETIASITLYAINSSLTSNTYLKNNVLIVGDG